MKEAMEKKAEEHALEFVPPEEKWKEHHEIEFNKRRSSFIAGFQAAQQENWEERCKAAEEVMTYMAFESNPNTINDWHKFQIALHKWQLFKTQ